MKKYIAFKFLCIVLLFTVIPVISAQVNSVTALYQQGQAFMAAEDWYSAAESFMECLRLNYAHAGATAALAECYYELGEFDEALVWVQRARNLARTSSTLANLEAFTLIALGRLNEASGVINWVLAREPNNREALFAAAELDIAMGRAGNAVIRYREAANRFPDDRRLLISLSLVLGSLGESEAAEFYINRALDQHPGDHRVHYYAAYLASQSGNISEGIFHAENALYFRHNFIPARSLLASLLYRAGEYEEAARLSDELILLNRNDILSWYIKGISYISLGRYAEAQNILSTAVGIDPDNEFIRVALEELLISHTRIEDPSRIHWASWHFARGRDFRSRNLMEQSLFEYRRGLRLNPFARDRREYAELLRLQGYPARYLEELRFMQDLGLGDRSLDDAVESYHNLLSTALFRVWGIDPILISQPHWNLAIFSIVPQSGSFHPDAGVWASAYIRDILVHERNISPMDLELRQASFSSAFRTAREADADYFLIISVSESERDLSIKGELFVARTGARAAVFDIFRTGPDRLRNGSRSIVDQLSNALPFRGELILRRQDQGIIDKGRADGVQNGDEFLIVQRGRTSLLHEGIGLVFNPEDIVGTITIERADEEISLGRITRNGFFDRVSAGDEVFLVRQQSTRAPDGSSSSVDPELRSLLRTLRSVSH